MSLIEIVRDVMDGNGWPNLTTGVVGSTDENMRQSLALVSGVVTSIAFKKDWPELIRDHSFDTVADIDEYELPEDFHHLAIMTAYKTSNYLRLKGSLTPAQWYRCLNRGVFPEVDSYRIMLVPGDLHIHLSPTPSGVENVTLAYITKNIIQAEDGTPKPRFTADSDVSLIDEFIVRLGFSWRWRQKKGLDFTAELAEYNSTMRERFAQLLAMGDIPVGGRPLGDVLTNGTIGDQTIGV